MNRNFFHSFLFVLFFSQLTYTGFAQKKILFDNTKSETAGNADWIIDDNEPVPDPAQSGITQSTSEDYWQGALSSWGVEMVKRGYAVEILPASGSITYNATSNAQDLSNYDIFVVCEPNNPFTSSEKQAMIDFVQDGGGLFIVADHEVADRDGDGWDALDVWNDFFSSYNNPFGFTLDAGSNISKDPATNVANLPSNTILHGPSGDVDGIAFYNGATFTIDKTANSTAVGLVFYDGFSITGTTGVMAVCANYGKGRVVGIGDSSVAEDETAHDNSHTYPGWSQPLNAGNATGDDGVFLTNATIWLGESDNETELLTNPYFNSGTDGWWAYGADISTNNGEVTFDISNAGANPWDIQIGQGNLTLKQGYKYTLCWRAKRESGSLSLNVGINGAPYTVYMSDNPVNLDNSWQENCVEYIHTGEDASNVAVTVNMGGSDADVVFDYISLKEDPNNTVTLTFHVNMQFETVSEDGVFLEGSFNNWNTPVQMQANGSVYSTTLELIKGESIEYHFLNGFIPESVTGDCTTGEDQNRYLLVPNQSTTLDAVCFNSCSYCIDSTLFETNPGAGPVSFYGEMQVNGNRIYGERTGTPVQVKGMSLFWSIWYGEKFWNSGAVNKLVDDWDIELIRAPMSVENNQGWDYGYLHANGREKQLAFVDEVVQTAIARDIYVLIDYHSHYADKNPEAAVEFFSTVAQKYGQYDNVIFEIYNEPAEASWEEVKPYAEQVIDAIRQYSDNLIVVGTEFWSQYVDIASLSPVNDDNTAYVFHFYAGGDIDKFQQRIHDAINNGIALFASEWGNIYADGELEGQSNETTFANSDSWNELMDEKSISSANWCVYVDQHQNASGLFYDDDGMNGTISFTGENWDDQSRWTDSGHYVYDWLKEQAAKAPWRKAEKQGYAITYYLNGGYNGANPTFYKYNLEEAIELENPIKEGCHFDGWYTNANFSGVPESQIDAASSGNKEFYAKWSEPTEEELLYEPDFELGTYGWNHWGEDDSVTAKNGQIILHEPTSNSANLWDYAFVNYHNFEIKEGHRYTLAWRAKRASGNIRIEARKIGTYDAFVADESEFNGEWQSNTVVYDHTGATINKAELIVFVGGNSSDVTFEYISLKESLIPETETSSVTTEVSPAGAGTVTGAGTYEEGESVTLMATANDGYEFVNWTNKGNVVSENSSYTFTASEDASFKANFEAIPTYTITTTADPAEGGTVSGAGTYNEGESVTLTATTNEGYKFVSWTKNGSEVSTNSSYTLTVSEDVNYTANFTSVTGLVNITFQVDMQNETVSNEVYLRGSFNNWNSTEPLMNNGSVFYTTLGMMPGETVQYKFVNGDQWEDGIPEECAFGDYGNRQLVIPSEDVVLDPVCFNSCETCDVVGSASEVTFRVDMQNEDVLNDGVYLKFYSEGPNLKDPFEMQPSDHIYTVTVGIIDGISLEYNFVNGNPNTNGNFENVTGDCTTNGKRNILVPENDVELELVCFNSCEACVPNAINELRSMISVYPNPTSGKVTITGFTNPVQLEVSIYDMTGRLIDQCDFKTDNEIQVDLSAYPKGVYQLKLNTELGTINYKVQKK